MKSDNQREEYQEEGYPYVFERQLLKVSGVILEEFEIFDGEKIKWGIRDSYESMANYKFCNSTPLFDDSYDDLDRVRKRVLYLNDDGCIIRYRKNNSDVLAQINAGFGHVIPNYMDTEDFGGKNVKIVATGNNKVSVKYGEPGSEKHILFDCSTFHQYGNEFDMIYNDSTFLKSYRIGNNRRPILGVVNQDTGEIKPIGFDLTMKEFIDLPLDENGYLDDKKMQELLNKQDPERGFNWYTYQQLSKYDYSTLMSRYGIEEFLIPDAIEVLCVWEKKVNRSK